MQDRDVFQAMLEQGAAALGIGLAPEAALALATYYAELKRWSGKVNLIAKNSTDQQIIENHFLDSLTLLPLLPTGLPACSISVPVPASRAWSARRRGLTSLSPWSSRDSSGSRFSAISSGPLA